jgi:hypothetical protein
MKMALVDVDVDKTLRKGNAVTPEAEIGEVKAPTGGRSNHQGNNEQDEYQ